MSELQVQISVLEAVKVDLNVAKDKIDEKEAELEAVNSEVAVFKETINGLKANLANKGQVCYQLIFLIYRLLKIFWTSWAWKHRLLTTSSKIRKF